MRKKLKTPKRGSVLDTQAVNSELEKKRNRLREELAKVEQDLAAAYERHRELIRVSLTSSIPEEREMAERVADWWEVERPPKLEGVSKTRKVKVPWPASDCGCEDQWQGYDGCWNPNCQGKVQVQ